MRDDPSPHPRREGLAGSPEESVRVLPPRQNVARIAKDFAGEIIERGQAPEHKPWGMYELSLNAPDDTLVRVGWPSALIDAVESR